MFEPLGIEVMNKTPDTVRIIRVFVSSPSDVQKERDVLKEVIESINRTDGQPNGFRLESFRWEDDVIPQIGPRPQHVVDEQMPVYDIYLGIMSTRFGTPTGQYGSGISDVGEAVAGTYDISLGREKKNVEPWPV